MDAAIRRLLVASLVVFLAFLSGFSPVFSLAWGTLLLPLLLRRAVMVGALGGNGRTASRVAFLVGLALGIAWVAVPLAAPAYLESAPLHVFVAMAGLATIVAGAPLAWQETTAESRAPSCRRLRAAVAVVSAFVYSQLGLQLVVAGFSHPALGAGVAEVVLGCLAAVITARALVPPRSPRVAGTSLAVVVASVAAGTVRSMVDACLVPPLDPARTGMWLGDPGGTGSGAFLSQLSVSLLGQSPRHPFWPLVTFLAFLVMAGWASGLAGRRRSTTGQEHARLDLQSSGIT